MVLLGHQFGAEGVLQRFLDGALGFTGIPALLEAAVARFGVGIETPDVDELVALDAEVRAAFATTRFGVPA